MKRLMLLAVALVVMAAVAGGGMTLALFSAGSGPTEAEYVSGTVAIDAQRDMGDGIPGPMFYIESGGALPNGQATHLWAPGDSHQRILQVENIGSLEAKLMKLQTTLQSGSSYLAANLDVVVSLDEAGADVLASGKLGDFIGAEQIFTDPVVLAVGDVTNIYFRVSLPLGADNTYQNLSAVVDFMVYAEQTAHN